jgi:WD40 repeat protein
VGDDSTVLTFSHSSGKFKRFDDARLPAFLFGAAWRPDSLYALVVGADGAVFNFNGQSLTPYCASRANYFRCVDWLSDSSEALIVGSGGIILRFHDGIFQSVDSKTSVDLFSCSWNPKTRTALICGSNSTLLRLETNGTVTRIPFVEDWSLYAVSWNPNGDKALITGANGNIVIYDGANIFTIHNGTPDKFLGCCWKTGSESAFMCGDAGTILEYSAGTLTMIRSGLQSQLFSIRFRPQGDYALSVGYFAKVARYPRAPRPASVCLLENPLIIGGLASILVGVILAYFVKERLDRRQTHSAPEYSRRQRLKERRRK